MPTPTSQKFRQITADNNILYALDVEGRVWKYIPSIETRRDTNVRGRHAFWTRLTDHRPQDTRP